MERRQKVWIQSAHARAEFSVCGHEIAAVREIPQELSFHILYVMETRTDEGEVRQLFMVGLRPHKEVIFTEV